jgi:hypothetical protein
MKISCCLSIFFFYLAGVWSQGYRGESSMDEGTLSEVRAQGEYQFQAWVVPWMMRWVSVHESSRPMFFPKSFIWLTHWLLCDPVREKNPLTPLMGAFLQAPIFISFFFAVSLPSHCSQEAQWYHRVSLVPYYVHSLRCLCFGDVAEPGVIAQNSGGSWFLEFFFEVELFWRIWSWSDLDFMQL